MSNKTAAPSLVVYVHELLNHPGAHRHVVLRGTLPEVASPFAWVPADVPVLVEAEVESVVEGLLVRGEVSTTATVSCVGCLTERRQEVSVEVQELFALDSRDAEEDGYAVLPDDRLPMDTMVRDALVLAFPFSPLCRPDCAGLCPVCGANRNEVDCGHDAGVVEERWSALAGLREQLARDGDAQPGPPAQTAGRQAPTEEEDDARPEA
ncbi:MAG TPA: DUF177 domain-containing protein [Actinomycetota bacterium]|jgi:uncharacterized protein